MSSEENMQDIPGDAHRDELHEELCAYLLGEADDAMALRVEAALEQSADLRAEADQLRATFDLVRANSTPAVDRAEEISAAARLAGEHAPTRSSGGSVIPFHAHRAVKLAAGFVGLAAAGFFVVQAFFPSGGRMALLPGDLVADSAAPARSKASAPAGSAVERLGYYTASPESPELTARELEQLGALGYGGGTATGSQPAVGEYRGPSDTRPPAAGSAGPGTAPAVGSEVVMIGRGGGSFSGRYGGRARDGETDLRQQVLPSSDFLLHEAGIEPSAPDEAVVDDELLERLKSLGYTDADVEFELVFDEFEDADDIQRSQTLAEVLSMLGLGSADLPDLLEGLGLLPTGYTGDLSDDIGRDAVDRFVDSRREELEQHRIEQRLADYLSDCVRRPGESLRDMFFRHWGQRPFVDASVDPLSTFGADVDSASYTLTRRMLLEGILPSKAQVRTEEFVNYFDAGLEAPLEETFAIHTDLGPAAFAPEGSGTWMLRVGVAGRDVSDAERKPMALTFVVDTSGSMRNGDRLELVKNALRQLVTKLDSRDQVAIVRFSNEAAVVLPATNAAQRGVIEAAIAVLEPKGGTNVERGLELGYDLAVDALLEDANNRVVFLSDGVGNIGETDQERLVERVADRRAKGVYLNTIGFGIENHNDMFLEQLANRGDGLCNYVDSELEARRALVENFTGAFETIARDVKIQVEFDPRKVGRYRLLGYENRAIADREFRQDAVDAGEVGAGHTVVALYELEDVDLASDGGALATVRVRYKEPFDASLDRDADEFEPPADEVATEIEATVTADGASWSFETLPPAFAAAQCSAQLAEVLRRSAFTRGDSIDALDERLSATADRFTDEAFRELAGLIGTNRAALEALIEPANEVQGILDELKYLRYELEAEREAEGSPDPDRLAALESRVEELEGALERALIAEVR